MNRIQSIVLVGLMTVAPSAWTAPSSEMWGRAYDYSCGYFSRRAADVSMTLKDDSLPYGTEVNLILGFAGERNLGGGKFEAIQWQDRKVVAARAIDKFTWEAQHRDQTLRERTSGQFLDRAQFVWEIIVPGEPARYLPMNKKPTYYESESLFVSGIDCVKDGKLPRWKKISFK